MCSNYFDGGKYYSFEAFFDELMFEHSQDSGGVSFFPGGYLFQDGDMEVPFYEGTIALDIGTLSGIVETGHGYHIILRLPIDYDSVPISSLFRGDDISLRMRTAIDMFDFALAGWMDSIPPAFTAEFYLIDLLELFPPCDH